jgi:putative hemolysin
MQDQRLSMMLVTNEYGGIAGLVTLKQLIEVIVGTVVDDDPPSAEADSSITQLEDGAYLVEGGMTIIEINDRLNDVGIAVPEGEYHTIAGLVLHEWGEIPTPGDAVRTGDLVVTVTDLAGARINQVRLERVSTAEREATR